MTVLAQHGWGKGDKIESGLSDGSIQGVIMSPRDELPGNLASYLNSLRDSHPSAERLVDPLFHIGTVSSASDGKLPRYPHYNSQLTPRSFSATNIQNFVRDTLDWERGLSVSAFVSPTVMVDDLSNQWAQIAMMLAQDTISQHDGDKPLLISLVIGEEALRQRALVDSWLDDLTMLDVDGFYLVIRRTDETYRQNYDPDILASLLNVCFSLAEVNQYRVFAGYMDMVTLLLHAVGVTGTGAGWYATLKQFTLRRFQQSTGGRQARARYSSRPLLNSIYMTELDSIYYGRRLPDVISGTTFDTRFGGNTNPENVPWPPRDSALHHWQVLDGIIQSIAGNTISDRLDSARNLIALAYATYVQVGALVPFTSETGPTHLDQWREALDRFRNDAGV